MEKHVLDKEFQRLVSEIQGIRKIAHLITNRSLRIELRFFSHMVTQLAVKVDNLDKGE